MRDLTKPFIILAANNNEDKLIEELNNFNLEYKEVQGCYRGKKERSFLVINNHPSTEARLHKLARAFNQESYLKVYENDRKAQLIYLNDHNRVENIGYFQSIGKSVILDESLYDAYTYDPSLDTYYVCDKRRK